MISRLRLVIRVMMGGNMRSVVRCNGMVGSNVMWGMVGRRSMMRGMRIVRPMFLLNMNEWVVIRIQVEFVESGLSFAVDFEPMVALKSLLVEEGAIRA